MNIKYVTSEDLKKEIEEIVSSLKEEQKTDIIFNNENLYYLGVGHDFIRSFFKEYITKTGIKAIHYLSGNFWSIDNTDYLYDNNVFKLIVKEPIPNTPLDFKSVQFPVINNVNVKTISDQLISVKPIIKIW